MTDGGRYLSPPCRVVRSVIWGKPVLFTITQPQDVIQQWHVKGEFYEREELEIIRRFCPPGALFCDIGANIGNHALFALLYLHVREVILFEPNPAAVTILMSNIVLNGVSDRCRTTHLGLGLSDGPAEGLSMDVALSTNLGGARMVAGTGGPLRVEAGDGLLAGDQVDFIKLDVEGMEMKVLAGLEQTIARCRPTIFVEVDNANSAAFDTWLTAHGYGVRAWLRRYRVNRNYLIQPLTAAERERADAAARPAGAVPA